jgi:outer membrane protein TolC
MRSPSDNIGAATWAVSLLVLSFAGCSYLYPPPAPSALTREDIAARVLSPVSLEQLDKPAITLPVAPPAEPVQPPPPSVSVEGTGPQQFSLPEAVEFGLKNNPRLMAALAAIEQARGQEKVAFSPFLPQVALLTHSGVTSPKLGPAAAGTTGIVISGADDIHSFAQVSLEMQWTLYDFGRTVGRFQQATARAHIAELQSARAEQTVGFDVATAYLQVQRASAFRLIQEEAIRRIEATLRDTRARRAAGVAEKDDVLRAEVQLAAAQEDLDTAREVELAAIAQLNNSMGRNASTPLQVIGAPAEPPLNVSLVRSLEIAAHLRPEVRIAQEAVAAAQAGRDATAAEQLPRIYIGGAVGALAGEHVAFGDQEGIGLRFDVPIYTGGRHRGELHAADAEVQQTIANGRSVLDDVTLQVTLAHLAATTARRRIDHDRPAIEEARENLRLVRNRYRNGNATPTDIVDAETALTGAQQRLASATYEYLAALVRLDYALGYPPGQLLGPPCASETTEPLPAPRPVPKEE